LGEEEVLDLEEEEEQQQQQLLSWQELSVAGPSFWQLLSFSAARSFGSVPFC
jgi:hypothetical protein